MTRCDWAVLTSARAWRSLEQATSKLLGASASAQEATGFVIRNRVRHVVDDLVGAAMVRVLQDLPSFVKRRMGCLLSQRPFGVCGLTKVGEDRLLERNLLDGVLLCVRYGCRRDIMVLLRTVAVSVRFVSAAIAATACCCRPRGSSAANLCQMKHGIANCLSTLHELPASACATRIAAAHTSCVVLARHMYVCAWSSCMLLFFTP